MMVKLRQVMEAINQLAPWDLAETWDNVGLQVGMLDRDLQRILVAVDLNKAVFEEGLQQKVDGFIIHHPLLFKPISAINSNSLIGTQLLNLIRQDCFVIAAHTNIDKAERGINQYLAEQLELTKIEILEPVASELVKIVVFTPEEYLTQVREAMAEAGAGVIGDYHECSFGLKGVGTFIPGANSNPFIGTNNQLEEVAEIRLEMIAPKKNLTAILKAIMVVHPYEEPAIDLYPLLNHDSKHGLGRIGHLVNPMKLTDACKLIKEKLQINELRVAGNPEKMIKKIAICSGSGRSLISNAMRQGADLYLTADLTYHDYTGTDTEGMALVDAGHFSTEKCFIPLMSNYLSDKFKADGVEIIPSTSISTDPYQSLK